MEQTRSGLARTGYVLVTVALWAVVAFSVGVVAGAVAGAVGDRSLSVDAVVSDEEVLADLGRVLGPGVEPVEASVRVRIVDPDAGQAAAWAGSLLGFAMLTAAVLWFLRAILRSVREGDPFTPANVRRLRWIGYLTVAYVPVGTMSTILQHEVINSTATGRLGLSFAVSFTPVVLGMGVLLLAEVFAHGIRLREDVEGTV